MLMRFHKGSQSDLGSEVITNGCLWRSVRQGTTALIERLRTTRVVRIAQDNRIWKPTSLWVIVFLLVLVQAHALDPNRRISQYGHTVWRTQDGLIGSDPDLTQTADGYIWTVNAGHYFRFDGTQFVPWKLPKGWISPSRSVTYLFGSRDGSLWIGGSGSLGRIKDGKISTLTKPTDRAGISSITEDRAGRIWVTRYRVPEGQGALCEVVGDALRCYGPSDGIPDRHLYGITEAPNGELWFGGDSLYRWRPGTKATPYLDQTKHPVIVDVAVDGTGDVWAAMDDVGPQFGVRYYHNGVWGEYSTAGFHSSSLRANDLFVDKDGALWIATETDGLYRVSGGVVDHFSKKDGLSGRRVSHIMEDHEGNVWVSTDGGMDMFRNLAATGYSTEEGLSSSAANTVFVSSDGVVWAGAYNGAESTADRSADMLRSGPGQQFGPGPKLPGRIESMYQDHSGAIWFGLNNYLAVFDHGRVEKVFDRDGRVLHFDSTAAITEDSSHTILVLSETRLFRIKDRRLLEALPLPKTQRNLGFLLANPGGGTLIEGSSQLWLYKNGKIEDFPLPGLDKNVDIYQIIADSVDPLLLATHDGLLRWDGKRWQSLSQNNGLPCKSLLSFIKDGHGSLWMQSPCGLLKMEASELEKWRRNEVAQPAVTTFDVLDGVQTGRSYSIQPIMSLAPDGRVWYASGEMVQSINPDQVYKNTLPPPVHVENVIADGQSYGAREQPHVAPKPHNLEIDYTALSFSVPQKVQFQYFLEGHDTTWQASVARRQAFYTDLAPGKYRFHVKASNNSGVWNEAGAVAEFVVEPTYYQTLWFKILVACAIAGLLWILYVMRLKQATAEVQKRLLTQMEERERIARELHDTLLQGFQGIALRVQGVTKQMPKDDPLREMMEGVLDRADEVMLEGRQRVRDLRQRTTSEGELPARLTNSGQKLAEGYAATFSLVVVGTPVILDEIAQEEAYRIAAEALINAFRHAAASRIEVEITYGSSELRIGIRDDGAGIDEAVLRNGHPGHWGLTGMRERAQALRAEFKIWSREAAGTEVELLIPASIAYPRKQKLSTN